MKIKLCLCNLRKLPYLFIALSYLGCAAPNPEDNYVLLKGKIDDLKANKLYIESNYNEIPFFDSVEVKNGEFLYQYRPLEESLLVKLSYCDAQHKKQVIHFQDPNNSKNSYLQFILENGTIILTGKSTKEVHVDGQNENRFFMHWNTESATNAYHIFDANGMIKRIKTVNENPKSTFLLQQVYSVRNLIPLNEFKTFFLAFDSSLQQTPTGKKMTAFITKKETMLKEKIDGTFVFNDTAGNAIKLNTFIVPHKLNLYIFWASWCVPCIAEVPALETFHKKYGNEVTMISLSIDNVYNNWKDAVKKQQMPWLNLSSLPDKPSYLKEKFVIGAVPQFMLINEQGEKILISDSDLDAVEKEVLLARYRK